MDYPMQAFQVNDFSHPAQLQELPIPSPAAGEVLLDIAACGLNFADLLMAKGQYQKTPPLPFIPGMELSGTVRTTGPGVNNLSPGDRVAVFAGNGGLAEQGCFSAQSCLQLPDGMPFNDAAAFQIAYGTSHLALSHRARLRAGETVLVLGAAGGVGLAAIEIAKLLGAQVIAVARGAAKLEIAKQAGADQLIDSNDDDLRTTFKALGGVDVVYDPVGGDLFRAALSACNPEARVITIGFASGDIPQIPANILLVKNITVIGFYWGGYLTFNPTALHDSLATLLEWYTQGKLRPHISKTFALSQTQDAMEFLRTRQSTGKVVVTPQPEIFGS